MALLGSFRNFSALLKSVATIGISNSVVKLFVENKEDEKEISLIYSTFFWLFLIISVVLGIVVIVFANPIATFIFFSNDYVIPIQLFGTILPLIVINTFWTAVYNSFEKFKRIVVIQITSNLLVFSTSALLIWKKQLFGGLIAIAVGEFLMVLVTFMFVRFDKSYFRFELQKVISKKYFNVIKKFSTMALLSAVFAPITMILVRNLIVNFYSISEAGIWDGVNRLSGFYMMVFSSGLSLYYMPKLASLKTDLEFKAELKSYFTTLVPLFFIMLISVFLLKKVILNIAFTSEFDKIESILIWQLAGDFFRIMTLAFGFQILVKTMMKRYFIIEIAFNFTFLVLSYFLVKLSATEGALQAYFCANVFCFIIVLVMFKKQLIRNDKS